jgi:cell division protein ZapA (FtsZ GTPase activity inhibitor)
MIELGPAAEDEAIARLREKEPAARTAAARILSAIGTQKCLIELRRAANDGRDPGAAASARSALGSVLARIKQAKATTTTATTTAPMR